MTTLLDDRRRGAEEAFFAKQNEQLRVGLRAAESGRDELSAASGLQSEAVLDTLIRQNIGAEGAAALSLIPLVAVAWADGEVSPKEREALLGAAKQAGLAEAEPGYKLFATWLDDHPPASLLPRWKDYASALAADMTPEAAASFRTEVMDRARKVASAAGGFLGMGAISEAEEAVLDQIEQTLSR